MSDEINSIECEICNSTYKNSISLITICKELHKICRSCMFDMKLNTLCPFCRQDMIPIDILLSVVCITCKMNPPMRANDSRMCEYCIKNIKIKKLSVICEEIVSNDCNDERLVDNYNLYEKVITYSKFNICSDNDFKKIKIFINKHNMALPIAISMLKNLYVSNNGLYFTAKQAKELVKKQWHDDIYKWHNILVFMCLEIYDLDVEDFTCGICYFANFGDKFTPFSYVAYINKRGFDIENKKSFF